MLWLTWLAQKGSWLVTHKADSPHARLRLSCCSVAGEGSPSTWHIQWPGAWAAVGRGAAVSTSLYSWACWGSWGLSGWGQGGRGSPEWGEGCWGCVTTRACAWRPCSLPACPEMSAACLPSSRFPQPVSRQLYFQPPAALSLLSLPRNVC